MGYKARQQQRLVQELDKEHRAISEEKKKGELVVCVHVCMYVRTTQKCSGINQTFFSIYVCSSVCLSVCLPVCSSACLYVCLIASIVAKPLRFLERIEKPPPRPPTPTVEPVPEVRK